LNSAPPERSCAALRGFRAASNECLCSRPKSAVQTDNTTWRFPGTLKAGAIASGVRARTLAKARVITATASMWRRGRVRTRSVHIRVDARVLIGRGVGVTPRRSACQGRFRNCPRNSRAFGVSTR
jgi:hypothetical protein